MTTLATILAGIIGWTLICYLVYRFFKSSPGRNRSAWIRRQRGGQPVSIGPLPYQKKWYLLSPAERDFYDVLCQAAGDRYLIFAKVRLLDLLWLPQNLPNRQLHMNRVQAKHVDFVLCDPKSVAPALVIELDDASHRLPERQERDIFLNELLQAAGIPLLRVPVRKSFSAPALRGQILETLGVGSRQETGAERRLSLGTT
jgi:very-short-patch-repair endonuclease